MPALPLVLVPAAGGAGDKAALAEEGAPRLKVAGVDRDAPHVIGEPGQQASLPLAGPAFLSNPAAVPALQRCIEFRPPAFKFTPLILPSVAGALFQFPNTVDNRIIRLVGAQVRAVVAFAGHPQWEHGLQGSLYIVLHPRGRCL